HVFADRVGLEHVPGHDRFLLRPDVFVHPLPADDLDRGDANTVTGIKGAARNHAWGEVVMETNPGLYGLVAEFETPTALVQAARLASEACYVMMDAYSPFPVEGLSEALGFRRTKMPMLILIGGIVGAISGFALQYYCAVLAYPINVAGRPLNSWPSWIPVT